MPKRKNDQNFSRRFILGCTAGVTSSLLLQPLDTFKTRIQGNSILFSRSYIEKELFNKSNFKPTNIWKGTVPTLLRASIGPGIYFSILENLRFGTSSPSQNFIKATIARTVAATVVSPLTILKTRFEWNVSKNPNIFLALKDLAQKERLRGLFVGLGPTLLRDVPQSALYLYFFSWFKTFNMSEDKEPSKQRRVFSALSAGLLSTLLTLPFDVLKTGVQIKTINDNELTLLGLLKKVIKENNFKSFFSGALPRLIRKPLQMTISWTIYDLYR